MLKNLKLKYLTRNSSTFNRDIKDKLVAVYIGEDTKNSTPQSQLVLICSIVKILRRKRRSQNFEQNNSKLDFLDVQTVNQYWRGYLNTD